MSRVNQAQMKKLLELLSEDGVLVDGRVMYTNTNKQNFWRRIALQLNSIEGGVHKNTWKWCKMWADWKNKTKKKANILLSRKSYTVEQPTPKLTNLELKLLKLINYPIDDKEDALTLEMVVSKEEVLDTVDDFQVNFLNNHYGDGDLHSEDKITSEVEGVDDEEEEEEAEEEKSTDFFDRVESKFCDVGNILEDDKLEEEEEEEPDEELLDYGAKLDFKVSETVFKKRKVSLEEYKVRTTLKIEKVRVQQKTEELRLRALELKLKGEELKQKEIEMNKINYLTSIEEEKLKCFRDISASLKELSDRTRSGTLRYHSVL